MWAERVCILKHVIFFIASLEMRLIKALYCFDGILLRFALMCTCWNRVSSLERERFGAYLCTAIYVWETILHQCRPIIVFYTEFSETLSNYTPNCHGLNIRPSTLSATAIYEASDESCTPWCNQRARLILEVVQTREGKLCMFSGLVQGKLWKWFTTHLQFI